jgi:hypothetical protein
LGNIISGLFDKYGQNETIFLVFQAGKIKPYFMEGPFLVALLPDCSSRLFSVKKIGWR